MIKNGQTSQGDWKESIRCLPGAGPEPVNR